MHLAIPLPQRLLTELIVGHGNNRRHILELLQVSHALDEVLERSHMGHDRSKLVEHVDHIKLMEVHFDDFWFEAGQVTGGPHLVRHLNFTSWYQRHLVVTEGLLRKLNGLNANYSGAIFAQLKVLMEVDRTKLGLCELQWHALRLIFLINGEAEELDVGLDQILIHLHRAYFSVVMMQDSPLTNIVTAYRPELRKIFI